MANQFTGQSPGRFNGSGAQRPRRVVRPPQELVEQVAQDRAKFPPKLYDDSYAKRVLDDWTLAYYFEGINVAYRSVPEGVEVLAIGDDEIGEFVKGKSQEELFTFTVNQP
jgi:hypothetical protein